MREPNLKTLLMVSAAISVTTALSMLGAAEAKPSKAKEGFLVPPPPPTPCVLPATFGSFPMQPSQHLGAAQQYEAAQQLYAAAQQQYLAAQQQARQEQAQASAKAHNHIATRDNAPEHPTAVSHKTENAQSATQSAALSDAERELQEAVSKSLSTVGEWTR